MSNRYQYYGAIFALAASCGTFAQDVSSTEESKETELEELIVIGQLSQFGATKSNVPIVETMRSISVETSDQFIEKGALNLSQTTSYMAGVTAETFGFSTRGDWVNSRGFSIPRYRDSIQELFGSYNTTRADVYTIEQVELLKGPASVLYGQGSPGGIINYVSKTPRSEAATEVVAEFGSFDRVEFAADTTGSITSDEKLLFRVVGLYRDADTQVDFVEDNNVIVMPSVTFAPTDSSKITVIAMYQDSDSDTGAQFIPVEGTLFPLPNGTFIDQDVYAGEPGFNQYNTDSTQITVLGEHRFNDIFSLGMTALWRDGEADYHQAWPAFTGAGASRYLNAILGAPIATDTTVARTFYQADNAFEQYAFDTRLTATFDTGALSHEVLMGVQYQKVETDSNSAYFFAGGALAGDFSFALDLANPVYTGAPDQAVFDAIYVDNPVQKVNDAGFYLSDQISIDNWRIALGLRYDDVDNDDGLSEQNDDDVSFSAGVLYAFDNGISPYLSYAESFETVVGTTLSGEQLKPEEGRQYEVGVKYEPQGFPGLLTASYFDIEISNLPNPNRLPTDAGQQLGESKLKGFEFEGRMILGDFYIQAALSFLDAEDPNGFELSSQPESNHSLWITWRPQEGALRNFRAGAGIRHVGDSVSENGIVRYETPNYTLGDLMFGYEFNPHWDIALNIRNVTDEQYLTSCLTRGDCFPGLRRTVNGTVTYTF